MDDQYGEDSDGVAEDFNVWPAVTDSMLLMVSLFLVYLVVSVHLRPGMYPKPRPTTTPAPELPPLLMTTIPLDESVLFDSGDAKPKKAGVDLVLKSIRDRVPQRIDRLKQRAPNGIVILEISGHADIRVPRSGSNWNLSTERANNIMLAVERTLRSEPKLATRLNIDLTATGRNIRPGCTILKAAGYSQYQPKIPYPANYRLTASDDPILKQNRRIEIRLYTQQVGTLR